MPTLPQSSRAHRGAAAPRGEPRRRPGWRRSRRPAAARRKFRDGAGIGNRAQCFAQPRSELRRAPSAPCFTAPIRQKTPRSSTLPPSAKRPLPWPRPPPPVLGGRPPEREPEAPAAAEGEKSTTGGGAGAAGAQGERPLRQRQLNAEGGRRVRCPRRPGARGRGEAPMPPGADPGGQRGSGRSREPASSRRSFPRARAPKPADAA